MPELPIVGLHEGLDAFYKLSEDWVDPDTDLATQALRAEGQVVVGAATIQRLPAVGGPFDGTDLQVPPGGQEVILPAAYGEGDMQGKVIYRREGNQMTYIGQPDQTDEDHNDDEDESGLILP